MQALILAGGKGTRLRPLTVYTPKPVVPVLNRPFLLYQIEVLKAAGVTDVTLSLSYQPDKIEHVLGDGSEFGIKLHYLTEPSPMGTAGAYKFAGDALRETTIVINGDILTDLDLNTLIEFHRDNEAQATLAIAPVENVSRYGVIETADDGMIKRFVEKPDAAASVDLGVNTINAGIYVLEPEVLDLIPEGTPSSFEYDIFPALLERTMPFFGFHIGEAYWRDIGTPENYLAAHRDFLEGKIAHPDTEAATEEIAERAVVDQASVIGEGCTVRPGARIQRSVIGPGVHIDEKAIIEDSVIWAHTRVSAGAEIQAAIVGRSCHIGRGAVVKAGAVLGDKTSLTDYTRT